MYKSARKVLTSPVEVDILDIVQLASDLAVITYRLDEAEFHDIFNVPEEEVMKALLLERSVMDIFATVEPDSEEDEDGHPSVSSARVTTKEGIDRDEGHGGGKDEGDDQDKGEGSEQ